MISVARVIGPWDEVKEADGLAFGVPGGYRDDGHGVMAQSSVIAFSFPHWSLLNNPRARSDLLILLFPTTYPATA